MPWTAYAKTFNTIIKGTARICGDYLPDGRNGRIWTWPEVGDEVNRSVLHAVDIAGGLRANAVIPLTKDVNVYDLPPDCLRLTRVNMHGLEGWIVMPASITEADIHGATRAESGDPLYFFREFLEPDQIGVLPIPYRTGSSFSRDSQYGLLRQIKDADGHKLPFDSTTGALRRIKGVPFMRSGTGQIIREVISPYGNLNVSYIRTPSIMSRPGDYPDEDLPEWFHKEIRYGAAVMLLRYRRNKIDQMRKKLFGARWSSACAKLQNRLQHHGPMASAVTPC